VTMDGVEIGNWNYKSTRTYKQYSAVADLHNLQFAVTHALGFSVSTSRLLVTELKDCLNKSSNHMVVWSRVPRNSGPRMTAPASASSNCIRQTRSQVREGANV
jgi:hypothetical protein